MLWLSGLTSWMCKLKKLWSVFTYMQTIWHMSVWFVERQTALEIFFSELFAVCIARSRCAHCQRELILINGKKLVNGGLRASGCCKLAPGKGMLLGVAGITPPNSERLVNMVWVKSSSDILGRPQSTTRFTAVSAELHHVSGLSFRLCWDSPPCPLVACVLGVMSSMCLQHRKERLHFRASDCK